MEVNLNKLVEQIFEQQTIPVCLKFNEASKMFCETLNDPTQIKQIEKATEGLLFKHSLSIINLEILWKISVKNPNHVSPKSPLFKEWNNSYSIIDSTFFENTVIQIRAFIDFAQKLAATSIGILKPIDNTKDFYKKLKSLNSKKGEQVNSIFKEMDETWGNDIRSIRDKILHYDIIKTNHEFRPTIQGVNYEKFMQKYDNHMFMFLTKLCEVIFEVEWISGSFDEFKLKHNRP